MFAFKFWLFGFMFLMKKALSQLQVMEMVLVSLGSIIITNV